jgi:hypothetical protein
VRPEDRNYAVLPFVYEPPVRPFIVVQARINNSLPLNFEVDTGSSFALILAPWVQQTLNLSLTDKTVTIQPGNHVGQTTAAVQFSALTDVGSLSFDSSVECVVADLPFMTNYLGPRIAGILGGDFFRRRACRFDFDKRTLTFWGANIAPVLLPPPGSVTFPLVWDTDSHLPTLRLPLPGTAPAAMIVDMGMTESRLPTDKAQKLKSLATAGKDTLIMMDGAHQTQDYLLEALTLGSVTTPLVPVSSQDGLAVGSLGIDLLSRFRVTLDPVLEKLVLEPRASFPLRVRGVSGLTVTQRAGLFYVSQIAPTVVAPDLAVGDQVASVDEEEVRSLSYYQAAGQLMYGFAGDWMHLTVEKPDHKRVSMMLLRRSLYPEVAVSGVGVVLHQENAGGLRVLFVQPGSPAEMLGIRAADELVSVNGKAARPLSAAQVTDLLARAGLPSAAPNTLVFKSGHDGKEIIVTERVSVVSADTGASAQPADHPTGSH